MRFPTAVIKIVVQQPQKKSQFPLNTNKRLVRLRKFKTFNVKTRFFIITRIIAPKTEQLFSTTKMLFLALSQMKFY